MQNRPASDWLAQGRAQVVRGDAAGALALFSNALIEHPDSVDLAHAEAGLLWQAKRTSEAESRLRDLLARQPDHVAVAFLLAKILQEQGRMHSVEMTLRALFEQMTPDVDQLIRAIELLDDCGRKQAATELVERAIVAGSSDPRLHAYAGMLNLQLGAFDLARERYLFALQNDARALDWQSAYGLVASTRYARPQHPDFERLRGYLQRPALSAQARASVLFALAKASDDIADHAQAAGYLREANGIIDAGVDWSRKNWRRLVNARLDAQPVPEHVAPIVDFAPVFIVGLPRSGTTLVAERLSRHRDVCNRGELPWLPHLAQQLARTPGDRAGAAATYCAQVRQDDPNARWFIDKQPLNFMHVDLIASVFPNAKILWCRRNSRDTALSIWMQYFAGPENNFAYDFGNIAAVAQGSARLLARAHERHPQLIHEVRYETLTDNPDECLRALAGWIGLSPLDDAAPTDTRSIISTSSAWQARQPVYRSSVGRWQAYAPWVPELLQFPDD
ncbi:MAG: sulfotransferase [Dokdonella sp.]